MEKVTAKPPPSKKQVWAIITVFTVFFMIILGLIWSFKSNHNDLRSEKSLITLKNEEFKPKNSPLNNLNSSTQVRHKQEPRDSKIQNNPTVLGEKILLNIKNRIILAFGDSLTYGNNIFLENLFYFYLNYFFVHIILGLVASSQGNSGSKKLFIIFHDIFNYSIFKKNFVIIYYYDSVKM
jgi:hypothetical protein